MALPARTSPSPAVLEDVVRRIVEVARPETIILFGSADRGEMGPHSDINLLVVKAGAYRKREVAARVYRALHGVDEPVDVIVATPEDVERYRDVHAVVIKQALAEGKVLYAA